MLLAVFPPLCHARDLVSFSLERRRLQRNLRILMGGYWEDRAKLLYYSRRYSCTILSMKVGLELFTLWEVFGRRCFAEKWYSFCWLAMCMNLGDSGPPSSLWLKESILRYMTSCPSDDWSCMHCLSLLSIHNPLAVCWYMRWDLFCSRFSKQI